MNNTFSWSEKLTLINELNPSDEEIFQTFKITMDELDFANECMKSGVFKLAEDLDVDLLKNIFSDKTITSEKNFASKPKPEAKKRGRKGDNILKAYMSIPSKPTPIEQFAQEHNVSLPVLKQSKRFDKTGLEGTVRVKKLPQEDKKVLMIWREHVESK